MCQFTNASLRKKTHSFSVFKKASHCQKRKVYEMAEGFWRSDALAKWRYDEVMFRNDASLAKWCVFTAEVTLRAVLCTFKSAWIKKWFSCDFDRKLQIKFGEKSCQRRQKELLWLIYLENTIDFLKIEHVFSSKFVRTVSLRLLPYQLILYLYTSFRETKPSKAETF